MSLALRLGLRKEDMENMSFVSLFNTLISATGEEEKKATQSDIDKLFR